MNCVMCGSQAEFFEEFTRSNGDHVVINKCPDCGSKVMLDNVQNYNDDYYVHLSGGESRMMEMHNANQMKQSKNNGSFLDYGCSNGHSLKNMQDKGFEVYGYDIHYSVLPEYNIPKAQVYIRDLPERFFDVIQLREVFEHLEKPLDTLDWCYDHLEGGGFLFLQTPMAENEEHPGRYAKGHLFLTSTKALSKKLASLGFRNVKVLSTQQGCLFLRAQK